MENCVPPIRGRKASYTHQLVRWKLIVVPATNNRGKFKHEACET